MCMGACDIFAEFRPLCFICSVYGALACSYSSLDCTVPQTLVDVLLLENISCNIKQLTGKIFIDDILAG